jgi:hypothetical protein
MIVLKLNVLMLMANDEKSMSDEEWESDLLLAYGDY